MGDAVEWDRQKAAQNIAKHGVPFDYAARVFLDPYRLDSEDQHRAYSEARRLTLGRIEWRVYAVAYTVRGQIIRLISARKANQREQRKYYEALPT
jgi:uncharacterized DUF497 family protein